MGVVGVTGVNKFSFSPQSGEDDFTLRCRLFGTSPFIFYFLAHLTVTKLIKWRVLEENCGFLSI
ncbi:hypothetical protein WN55_04653 [Dufourea novaeangliae]|uniref:Uncharacterized protein n=1 Tax=Dufourea novaeangliae TaxID=178035 RepID=A0A154P1J8_DUFNO|nr:hypothetical protein WN55_04653 [Dufourea novaeangliae]